MPGNHQQIVRHFRTDIILAGTRCDVNLFHFYHARCSHRWKLKCSPQMQLKGGDLREIAIDRVQANLMFEVYATIKFHSNIHGRQKSLEKFIF